MNILIVDDHPLFRHALIQAVRYSLPQAQIQETADVDEFYERLEHGAEPDLVLLDLNLPGASGFSALVYVRAQYPAIPIIVVSAHEEVSIIQRATAHGAMGYIKIQIIKPRPPVYFNLIFCYSFFFFYFSHKIGRAHV